jgi:hypothetical protein
MVLVNLERIGVLVVRIVVHVGMGNVRVGIQKIVHPVLKIAERAPLIVEMAYVNQMKTRAIVSKIVVLVAMVLVRVGIMKIVVLALKIVGLVALIILAQMETI